MVLMAEQDPDVHLPLVKLVAHLEEVVIDNLLEIVTFNALQLRK